MIADDTKRQMRQRAEAARSAVDTVALHTDGGLFGGIPPQAAAALFPAAVESARDVPALLDELERLAPAAYVVAHEACRERDCDHVDWETNPDAECPEVEHRVATLADVKRAEYLAALVEALCNAARRLDRGEDPDPSGGGRDMTTLILEGAANTEASIAEWETTGEEPA